MRNLAVAAVLFAAACSHQQQAATSSGNLSAQNASTQQPIASPPIAAAAPRMHCVACASIDRQNVAGHDSCPIVRVHFAFDDDQLSDIAKATLARHSECFRRGATQLSVEGNADERGTESYNQALGQRRAHSVVSYLRSLGVPEDDLRVISYGKDRPLCLGHTESCWEQNRRVTLRPGDLSASTPRNVQ